MLKILHMADLHVQDSFIDECRDMLNHITVYAREFEPDVIIIAGDLTHRYDVKLDSQTTRLLNTVFSQLRPIAPIVICGGTHFHDGRTPEVYNQIISDMVHSKNIHVAMDDVSQICLTTGGSLVRIEDAGADPLAVISIVPAPTKRFMENTGTISEDNDTVAAGLGAIFAGLAANIEHIDAPHILVGHWSIGGAYTSETQQMIGRDIEVSQTQVAMANADLVCLGHIHKQQRIGTNIFYPGSIYSLNAGEMDDKGFYTHELDAKGYPVKSEFIKLPATKRILLKEDFTQDEGIPDIGPVLYQYTTDEIAGNIIHVSFRMWQDHASQVNREDIESFFRSAMAKDVKIDIVRVPRENVRCEEFLRMDGNLEKLQHQAKIREEPELSQGIVSKIQDLEGLPADEIIKGLPTE